MTNKIKQKFCYNNKNEKVIVKNGDFLRPHNSLYIFDDIFDKNFIKSEIFIQLLCILRHLQISVVFISQSHEIILTRMIKSQSDMIVIMKTSDNYAINAFIRLIEAALIDEYNDKERNKKAKILYTEKVLKKQYGKIIIDSENYILNQLN